MSAVEFRKHAAEHLDWARQRQSDRERQTFQQMAEAWLEAAASWERAPSPEDWMLIVGDTRPEFFVTLQDFFGRDDNAGPPMISARRQSPMKKSKN